MKKCIMFVAMTALATAGMYAEQQYSCQGANTQNGDSVNVGANTSYDPNEMAGPAGVGEQRYVKPGEWMDYTIYYENYKTASAAAIKVAITLPKDANLDWSTLELGEVAFGTHIDMGLAENKSSRSTVFRLAENGCEVRTVVEEGEFDVTWRLRIWDPTTSDHFPDDFMTGVLPPNDDTGRGEGHVRYRVKVKDGATLGSVTRASASIVFDDNDPIETDPAWWNTVGIYHTPTLDLGGGVTTNLTLIAGRPFGELPAPEARVGYAFDAWYTGLNGAGLKATPTAIVPEEDFTLHDNWTGNAYKVRFDANGGDGSMPDQAFAYGVAQKLAGNGFSRKLHSFLGWAATRGGEVAYADRQDVQDLTAEDGGVVTLYAVWEKTQTLLWPDGPVGAMPLAAASVYDGYLYNKSTGALAGTIQVKVGKPGKDGKAAVKATVVGLNGKKKSLKAVEKGKATIESDGTTTVELVGGDACEVKIGAKGMSGTYGSYDIDGALNVFASKDAADKATAAAVLGKWQGVVNVAWRSDATERLAGDGSPYHTLSVTIANKGKAKVAGTLADGTKVSARSQLLVGDEWCCVPVLEPKKSHLAFVLWLPADATGRVPPMVVGLENAIVGKPGTLKAGAEFRMNEVLGDAKYADYLPNGVPVTGGAKWVLPKAGKVQLAKDGLVDVAKLLENPSALKLTYTVKTGSFKGSFKAYSDVRGKPKGVTVNMAGVLVDGIGYGAATIKKVGSVPVTISDR